MRDKTLISLVLVAAIFHVGHMADHIVRGDFPWPPTMQSLPPIIVTIMIYAVAGSGIYLYWNRRVGPRFWAIAALIGTAMGWLGHFSPFTDQPPRYIFNAYNSVIAGSLAVGCLVGLMLTLIGTAIYAGYLWSRQSGTAALPSR